MVNAQNLVKGGRYNWKGQKERLVYIGTAGYTADHRIWYQFAKENNPNVCWSEVPASDLSNFEESEAKPAVSKTVGAGLEDWSITMTTKGELVVCAPKADPGSMTLRANPRSSLPLRMLYALGLAVLKEKQQ